MRSPITCYMRFFRDPKPVPHFAYRSEAFDYYFSKGMEEGRDEMQVVEQADKFADIVARNKRLPDAPPPQMNTIEKGVYYAQQIASIKSNHPEVWDLLTGVAGGLIGGFTGGATVASIQEPPRETIDFDKL